MNLLSKAFSKFVLVVFMTLFGQSIIYGQASVNQITGAPFYEIPITSISQGDIQIPFNLVYSSSGNRVNDEIGQYGRGWHLRNSENFIRRVVRGLPDDCDLTNKKGWNKRPSGAGDINIFSPTADDDFSDSSDEKADYESLLELAVGGDSVIYDTEPDIYFVQAFGLSLTFLYDNDGIIRTIPHSSGIEITEEGGDFKIRNGHLEYTFDLRIEVGIATYAIDDRAIPIGKKKKLLYDMGAEEARINYVEQWYLTSIESNASSAKIEFKYFQTAVSLNSTTHYFHFQETIDDNYGAYVVGEPNKSEFFQEKYSYSKPYAISEIKSEDWLIEFESGNVPIPRSFFLEDLNEHLIRLKKPLASSIRTYARNGEDLILKSRAELEIIPFFKNEPDLVDAPYENFIFESYLNRVDIFSADGASIKPYLFKYYGLNYEDQTTDISLYTEKDLFGYADIGFLTITDLTPSGIGKLKNGMLRMVSQPLGGESYFFYQPNTYFDSETGSNKYGGGLRVSSLVSVDNEGGKTIVSYEYEKNEEISSGVLIDKPVKEIELGFNYDATSNEISFDVFENETKLQVLENKNDHPLSDTQVNYSVVTERRKGFGHSVFHYDIPDDFLNTGNQNKIARQNLMEFEAYESPNYLYYDFSNLLDLPLGLAKKDAWLRNGRLVKKEYFSEQGELVGYDQYTYENTVEPIEIKCLDYELIPTGFIYGSDQSNSGVTDLIVYKPYEISVGGASNVVASESYRNGVKVSSSSYVYDNVSGLLIKEESVDSKGITHGRKVKYAMDYNTSSSNLSGFALDLKELNNGGYGYLPIESINYFIKSGTEYVTGGQISHYEIRNEWLLKMATFGTILDDPKTGFNSSSIAGNSFDKDPSYIFLGEVLDIDVSNRQILSSRNRYGEPTGTAVIQKGLLVASFDEVAVSNVGFTNFDLDETASLFDFSIDYTNWNDTLLSEGRYGKGLKLELGSAETVSKIFTKADDPYVVSFWAKSNGSSQIKIALSEGAVSELSTITLSNHDDWKYYRKELDLSNFNDEISLELYATQGEAIIDDLLLYPRKSGVTYRNYDERRRLQSENTFNGKGAYYEYDGLNRPIVIRDDKGEILKAFEYKKNMLASSIPVDLVSEGSLRTVSVSTFDDEDANYFWAISETDFLTDAIDFDYSDIQPTSNSYFKFYMTEDENKIVFLKVIAEGETYYKSFLINPNILQTTEIISE